MTAWQSLFLPQAASGFAQALSTHVPQSVLPNDGGGGAAAGASAVALAAGASDDAEDADSAGLALSEAGGALELEDAELSSAGLSGGLDSPPPHASQASGTVAIRKRDVMGKRWARLMDRLRSAERYRIKARNADRRPSERESKGEAVRVDRWQRR